MDIRQITEKVSVRPQIGPCDMDAIAASGMRAMICNRPDGEGADQPGVVRIDRAAKAAGWRARHVPLKGGIVSDANVTALPQPCKVCPAPRWPAAGLAPARPRCGR